MSTTDSLAVCSLVQEEDTSKRQQNTQEEYSVLHQYATILIGPAASRMLTCIGVNHTQLRTEQRSSNDTGLFGEKILGGETRTRRKAIPFLLLFSHRGFNESRRL